jgi:hypothetical protein
MYYLGLLFYELFSGGEIPPPSLRALASHNGAFISLSTMALVETSGDREQDPLSNAKRHQGPSASDEGIGLCKLSCEYLKLIRITGPLCHLIFNMLDTVHGDLCKKDCYLQMSDVTADLRLMLSEPAKFLHGIDFDNTIFVRPAVERDGHLKRRRVLIYQVLLSSLCRRITRNCRCRR